MVCEGAWWLLKDFWHLDRKEENIPKISRVKQEASEVQVSRSRSLRTRPSSGMLQGGFGC